MDYQQIIKTILAWVMTNIMDEETLAVNLQLIAMEVIKPFVFAFVCGTYVKEYTDKLVQLIEPKTPDFSIN